MKDPYRLLNVRRDADAAAIKLAYRKLAKSLHPDRNPGDRKAEQRFKDITQAYTLLSDPKSRQDFDRGRIDADGQTRRQPFGEAFGAHANGASGRQAGQTFFDRVFGTFARAGEGVGLDGNGQRSAGHDDRTGDQHHRLDVDFLTAARGGKQRFTPSGNRTLDVDIPPGTEDNAVLRLRGQGRQGDPGGDLLVQVRVLDHRLFSRRGRDVYLDLPISLKEALLGARVQAPTIDGTVALTIPPNANSGQMLRLKGKGVAHRGGDRGDQYVRLIVTLPKNPSAAMAADLGRIAEHDDYEVRDDLDRD